MRNPRQPIGSPGGRSVADVDHRDRVASGVGDVAVAEVAVELTTMLSGLSPAATAATTVSVAESGAFSRCRCAAELMPFTSASIGHKRYVTFEDCAFVVRLANDRCHAYTHGSALVIDEHGHITATDPRGLEWRVPRERWLDVALDGERVVTNRWRAQRPHH